jgi:hypothetical protein
MRSCAFDRISKQRQISYPGIALYVALGTGEEVTVGKENGSDGNECPITRDIAEGATVRKKLAKETR